MENERLVKLDDLFDAIQVALSADERRAHHRQRREDALQRLNYLLLRRRRELLVALLRDGDRVEVGQQPLVEIVLRAVVLAVRQSGQFDGAAHVAGVGPGGRQLIDRLVAAPDQGGRDQAHPATDQVYGNDVEALLAVRRHLAEEGAEQIRDRRRGVDAFVPAFERVVRGGLDDRRAYDGDGQVRAEFGDQRFGETLGERVSVGPSQFPRAAHPRLDQFVARPALALFANLRFDLRVAELLVLPARFVHDLLAKPLGDLQALGPRLALRREPPQRFVFGLGVEIGEAFRGVIGRDRFCDAAVAVPHDVTGREVQQRRSVAAAQEIDQVKRAVNIDRQRLTQVGVEIGQAGAVYHQVETGLHALERRRRHPEARLRDVAFDDFDLFAQEGAEIVAVPGVQVFEERRFGDDLFEAAQSRRRTLAAYEQVDLGDLRNLFEDLRQPDLADEPCEADEQDAFARERPTHGEPFDLFVGLEDYRGRVERDDLAFGGGHRVVEHLFVIGEAKVSREPFGRDSPVGPSADDPRQRLPRPDHRREQTACGQAVAEFVAVGDQSLDLEIPRQRPHDVVEPLTDQHNPGPARLRLLQVRQPVGL